MQQANSLWLHAPHFFLESLSSILLTISQYLFSILSELIVSPVANLNLIYSFVFPKHRHHKFVGYNQRFLTPQIVFNVCTTFFKFATLFITLVQFINSSSETVFTTLLNTSSKGFPFTMDSRRCDGPDFALGGRFNRNFSRELFHWPQFWSHWLRFDLVFKRKN